MFKAKELVLPATIEEAYKIYISRKNNAILGGGAFLRMSSKKIDTLVDLSGLGLDYIREHEGYIEIGAYAALRDIETNPLLINSFNGAIPASVRHIIGVQFRNVATVGASVYSKYGFSDLITALLALDAEVELYKAGRMALEAFLKRPCERDILIKVLVKKNGRQASYQHLRNSASDYPILNAAVSVLDGRWRIAVGARPQRAAVALKASEELSKGIDPDRVDYYAKLAAEELSFGSNERGTAGYRQAMCSVLVKRAITEVLNCR